MDREGSTEELAREISGACLGLRARMLDRVVTAIFDRHLRPLGLRNTQVSLLTAIAQASAQLGAAAPADLGRWLSLEKSTVSRSVDRMIDQGWLETLSAKDGRSYRVRLSSAGEDKLHEAAPAWRAAQAEVEALLGGALSRELRRTTARSEVAGGGPGR